MPKGSSGKTSPRQSSYWRHSPCARKTNLTCSCASTPANSRHLSRETSRATRLARLLSEPLPRRRGVSAENNRTREPARATANSLHPGSTAGGSHLGRRPWSMGSRGDRQGPRRRCPRAIHPLQEIRMYDKAVLGEGRARAPPRKIHQERKSKPKQLTLVPLVLR